MTQPWLPLANPGGPNRRAARRLLADWLDIQHIGGVDHIYPGMPIEWNYDEWHNSREGMACLIGLHIASDDEGREAYTGPTDPGGKMVHHDVTIEVRHLTYEQDIGDAGMAGEDDADRIVDAVKDCLRGRGRDLGRPDVVLQIGEYPREGGIRAEYEEPVIVDGSVERVARIYVTISQYLVSNNDPAH